MSGTKVMYVVTAQEYAALEAERDRMLVLLNEAVLVWQQGLTELGMLTDDKVSLKLHMLKEIKDIYAKNFFEKAGETVRKNIRQLQHDVEQTRIEKRARELAFRRSKRQRLLSAARAIAAEFRRTGCDIPADFKQAMENVAGCTDAEFELYQKIVNTAMPAFLAQTVEGAEFFTIAHDLVASLKDGLEAPQQISALRADEMAPPDPKVRRLDKLIAELEIINDPSVTEVFMQRVKTISTQQSDAQRELLVDSLMVDLSDFCRKRRERAQATSLLLELQAELKANTSPAATSISIQVDFALKRLSDVKTAQQFVAQARAEWKREVSKEFAATKRQAVLDGFAALGYEIKDGMATAWARNGRIVVSKKATPTLGIEIGSSDTAEHVQVRAVAIVPKGRQRSSESDRDVELGWCSELAKIREVLLAAGTKSEIETALPAGSTPLKVCESKDWMGDEAEEAAGTRKSKTQTKYL